MHDARLRTVGLIVLGVFLVAAPLARAQRYTNTSPGRPLQVEDAIPFERFALEARLAPANIANSDGWTRWSVEPGISYGIVPKLQIDLAAPVGYHDAAAGGSTGVAGVSLSALYAFNVESQSLPAIALRAGAIVPVGSFGPRRMHESIKGIATRSFSWGRLHFNHQYTFGDEPGVVVVSQGDLTASSDVGGTLARWNTGVAVDRAFPLVGVLVGAELFARHPLADSVDAQWHAGLGVRYQFSASVTIDVGGSAAFTGADRDWSLRLGIARWTSMQRPIPGLGRWGR